MMESVSTVNRGVRLMQERKKVKSNSEIAVNVDEKNKGNE